MNGDGENSGCLCPSPSPIPHLCPTPKWVSLANLSTFKEEEGRIYIVLDRCDEEGFNVEESQVELWAVGTWL
jgi:hypothetical protein